MSAEIETLHKPCSVPGCRKKFLAKGLCGMHYQRSRLGADMNAPDYTKIKDLNPNWKGGVTRRSDGRHFVYAPNHPHCINGKYVLRYRLMMEEKLGRILLPSEIVHHINGDPSDDRIENLEITTQRDHRKKFHTCAALGQWARKFKACISCGSDKRPHVGRGLCRKCHPNRERP